MHLFRYVIAALQKVDASLGQSILELLQSLQKPNIQTTLTDLINGRARFTQAITLATDDYHLISNPTIYEAITFLLENAPPQFHLVLISHANPPFSLARLGARHQITEIRQDD